ncbi:50S ribosomal protein L30 [Acidianus brierleyi]|uniref:Large ribosomal subunit protein uL30 n=1 Tax=Acidianus brierleyi TaxID=41673 RepID=A0A2U9IEB8_9CREN|nr:50S ribosomal protein L30 [Acidianus brierleyi]AWR94381.1 50S ribosomal protein L30 [Acidianus brierleyi]
MSNSIIAIRIRGSASAPWNLEETLEMLRLKKQFNAMIYPDNDSIRGMLMKVQSYITWGKANDKAIDLLLSRIHTINGDFVNENFVKEKLSMSLEDLKQGILEGKVIVNKYDNLFKLPIRLHPPRGGFKGKVNKPYGTGGEFGYRGDKILELIERMI